MKINRILITVFLLSFLGVGCLDILSVDQPVAVPVNYTFNVTVSFQTNQDSAADGSVRFGAVKLPVEITLNNAVMTVTRHWSKAPPMRPSSQQISRLVPATIGGSGQAQTMTLSGFLIVSSP